MDMITKHNSLQLQKDFRTIFLTKQEFSTQVTLLAQAFNEIFTRLDHIEARQKETNKQLRRIGAFIDVATIKLLNHDTRIVSLESKILLS